VPEILLIPVFFLAIWFGVLNLVAFIGGWTRLARSYPAPAHFEGKRWRMRTGMGRFSMHYGNCLQIGANAEGLRVAVFFPFRPGHPPLYFPWADITITYERMWLSRWARLQFAQEPGVPFYLPEHLLLTIGAAVTEKGLGL
jgi:hypothetical protein